MINTKRSLMHKNLRLGESGFSHGTSWLGDVPENFPPSTLPRGEAYAFDNPHLLQQHNLSIAMQFNQIDECQQTATSNAPIN